LLQKSQHLRAFEAMPAQFTVTGHKDRNPFPEALIEARVPVNIDDFQSESGPAL
jgi:hypothetical protein